MSNRYSQLLLILWIILGAGLRFHHLTAKPIWTDEFATLVFSLGNHFDTIPLGQIIDPATLLSPLKPSSSSLNEVIQGILDKDNHPPLYFALAHLWLSLFPTADYVNLWAARALPALFGVLAIPLIYFLAYWITPQRLFAHLAALLMAVSPYGVFISQEARHYTLAVIWVLLSVGCFLKSGQYLAKNQRIPPKLIFAWIIINSLGLSTHFFCGLAFFAEFLTLSVWFIYPLIIPKLSLDNFYQYYRSWSSLLWVILGTLTSVLLWLWVIQQRDYGNGMTQWIKQDNSHFLGLISPPFQLLAAWLTMICLFPVESPNLFIVIVSALAMLIGVIV
ncbi:MAG: phospholipid carrier-dependent glycosyltransferase, partial [Microcystaceae cyanobacterium]